VADGLRAVSTSAPTPSRSISESEGSPSLPESFILFLIIFGDRDVDVDVDVGRLVVIEDATVIDSTGLFTLDASLSQSIASPSHFDVDEREWPFPKLMVCGIAFCRSSSSKPGRFQVRCPYNGEAGARFPILEASSAMLNTQAYWFDRTRKKMSKAQIEEKPWKGVEEIQKVSRCLSLGSSCLRKTPMYNRKIPHL
jgi:hypothetical protein